ncbi:MAG TPA: alpha-amylase domain-containing protein [Puia sp.]|nr:alpha-amylase domain-containing protein [Puia sp.]
MKKLLRCGRCGLFLLLFIVTTGRLAAQNPWNGKVVMEGFWWDYWNNNFPNGWSNYLTELAPRLRGLGIDAVWVPPCIKNAGTNSVGYAPFDQYDLGDKWQKASLRTRLGTKDELLRMVGVVHANGMDVIQDAVLNHCSDAGSASSGAGGQDGATLSLQTNSGYKNFRYVCYSHPAGNESSTDYLGRTGRWPKNWENFYPNTSNNHYNTGDWDAILFGPDISYESTAYGTSTNATYNPAQSSDYMRTGARNWMIWFKKQTGADGFRLDAAKNYPYWAAQDFLWNVKYNASWAGGGANMFAVGEIVGSTSDEDTWISNVKTSNGGTEDLVGTFDFGFRSELKNMISAGGSYDLGSLPGKQQTNRYRTVPFVNNHDTYRPIKDANGYITGWDTGNELGGGHIDPNDVRIAVAYAVAFAVDGSPQVFFEDLFDLENTGKRYTHMPSNTTDLPVRDAIANIIWCHQKLNFKKGAYKVRWQAQDLLIIERGYNAGPENSYAIIGVNDNWNTWQNATIQTDFGANVQLHDYSGANSSDIWTDGTGKATIYVPPCDGSNVRRGYCIWGPAGVTGSFNPSQRSTTQEWEMSDDLGDSHDSSLKQGGAIPASSTAWRTAGEVFDQGGKTVTVNLFPTNTTPNLTVSVYNHAGTSVATTNGTGNLTLTYTPASDGFYTVKVKNTNSTNPAQTAYVKVTYTSPTTVSTSSYPAMVEPAVMTRMPEVLAAGVDKLSMAVYPSPSRGESQVVIELPAASPVELSVLDGSGRPVKRLINGTMPAGRQVVSLHGEDLAPGTYVVRMNTAQGVMTQKWVIVL